MALEWTEQFGWYRCPKGYRIVRKGEQFRGKPTRADLIAPKSDEQTQYPVVGGAEMVLNLFLRVKTEGDLLKFVNLHGSMDLLARYTPIGSSLRYAESFREILASESERPKKIAEAFGGHPTWSIGSLAIVPDRRKWLAPIIRFSSLCDVMWWQLCMKLRGATTYRTCRQCGELFEVGPGTGRRADATFCQAEHSVLFHSLNRSRGA